MKYEEFEYKLKNGEFVFEDVTYKLSNNWLMYYNTDYNEWFTSYLNSFDLYLRYRRNENNGFFCDDVSRRYVQC